MQVAARVLPQPLASQGALVGQARPQMATQYIPQQQAPILEVGDSCPLSSISLQTPPVVCILQTSLSEWVHLVPAYGYAYIWYPD